MFSAMLMDACRDERSRIHIDHRTDGHLLNSRRMQNPMRLNTTTIHGLLFVDDCALNSTTEEDMQWSMDHIVSRCAHFKLTINTDKTVIMNQQASPAAYCVPGIRANGTELKTVDNFNCLDSAMSRAIRIDDKVDNRTSKASHALGRLHNSVWNRHGLQQNTKLKIYKAVVLTALLYGAETWIVYFSHTKKSSHFYLTCLRRILKLRWQDRIPDREVLERTGIFGSHAMLRHLQLRWSGYFVRMEDTRLPKQPFYDDLHTGARQPGGPKERYKDTLKNSLKRLHIHPDTWEDHAQDR
nr:unnamed protein product [Spirometra erinaceieuropaei]